MTATPIDPLLDLLLDVTLRTYRGARAIVRRLTGR